MGYGWIVIFLRSCLKTQGFAYETDESDEEEKSYFEFVLIFVNLGCFVGRKNSFQNTF